LAKELNTKISERREVNEIRAQVDQIRQYISVNAASLDSMMTDSDSNGSLTLPHEALFQCIMYQGHKSFSHLLSVIESYQGLLQSLNEGDDQKLLTTKTIFSFWALNSQFLEIILGKLVNYRVIDSKSIISLILSSEFLDANFDRLFTWSLLISTLQKATLKARQLNEKIEKLKKDPDATSSMAG
jgi:nuclear cap-binding protein subunit 1